MLKYVFACAIFALSLVSTLGFPVTIVFIFSTRQAMAQLGLSGTSAYVRGRAAALGAATAPVVISAFAWFEPGLIESAYQAGPAELTPADLSRTRSTATGATAAES